MTVSHWQESPDPIRADHDDVVIGAGIVGSYAATVLRDRGRDVALVDARFPAAGASGRNAGFVLTAQREPYHVLIEQMGRPNARDLLEMVRRNVRRMRELAVEYGAPLQEGALHIAHVPPEARELEQWARALEADGIGVDYQPRDPYGAGFSGSMQIETDFGVHPARLTEAIAVHCGATRYDGNEVYAIKSEGDRLEVIGRLAHIRCRNVFVCTNGYTGNLHPYLYGLVRPVRGQMIMTTPLDPMIGVAGISDWYYFRQLPDGCVLVGGARRFYEEQEFTAEDVVTGNLQSNLEDFVRSWFPGTQFDIQRRWAGIHGFTPDRRVAVGLIPDEPRIAFALGFSGYGNSIGLVSAERMVELALDGVDPGPLSATRFS